MTVTDPDVAGRARATSSLALSSAAAVIQRWRTWVRALAIMEGQSEKSTELRGLAAWYERLCADERYSNPPPSDAIEALHWLERRGSGIGRERLAGIHGAVRVGEELTRYRRTAQDQRDELAHTVAVSRLELALHTVMALLPDRAG